MNALTLIKLCKTYANGLVALHEVDLVVSQGDFYALLGPNGAGKSTMIGILSGLAKKTSGTVKIFDYDISDEPNLAKACLGVVPQEFNFNQFETVIDIVVNQAGYYGVDRRTALTRAEGYLQRLGLWEKRHQISRFLSGGMKRRLMIARALIHQPKILILDEPSSGIDIELRRSTWEFLQELNKQGITIILTTHYLEEAENLCKGVGIINKGHLLESTTIKGLLTRITMETVIVDVAEPIVETPKLEYGCIAKIVDDNSLEISFNKNMSLNDIFKLLSDENIKVVSMKNKTNRLENLFLTLTGNNKHE